MQANLVALNVSFLIVLGHFLRSFHCSAQAGSLIAVVAAFLRSARLQARFKLQTNLRQVGPIGLLSALLLLTVMPATAWSAPEPIGMVLDVQGGKAQQVAGIVTRPLQMLAYLQEDDTLRLEAGVKVSFSLYKERKVLTASGPGEFKIKADSVQVISGTEPTAKSMSNQMVAAQSGSRMMKGATKMRSIKPLIDITSPRNQSLQLSATPVFRWKTLEPMAVMVEIRRSDSTPIFSQLVEAGTLVLPAPSGLAPGTYLWSVSAAPGSTLESMPATANFTVAETSQANEIRSLAPAPGAALEERMMYLSYLIGMNVTDEASQLWEDILKDRPDLKSTKLPLPQ